MFETYSIKRWQQRFRSVLKSLRATNYIYICLCAIYLCVCVEWDYLNLSLVNCIVTASVVSSNFANTHINSTNWLNNVVVYFLMKIMVFFYFISYTKFLFYKRFSRIISFFLLHLISKLQIVSLLFYFTFSVAADFSFHFMFMIYHVKIQYINGLSFLFIHRKELFILRIKAYTSKKEEEKKSTSKSTLFTLLM